MGIGAFFGIPGSIYLDGYASLLFGSNAPIWSCPAAMNALSKIASLFAPIIWSATAILAFFKHQVSANNKWSVLGYAWIITSHVALCYLVVMSSHPLNISICGTQVQAFRYAMQAIAGVITAIVLADLVVVAAIVFRKKQ